MKRIFSFVLLMLCLLNYCSVFVFAADNNDGVYLSGTEIDCLTAKDFLNNEYMSALIENILDACEKQRTGDKYRVERLGDRPYKTCNGDYINLAVVLECVHITVYTPNATDVSGGTSNNFSYRYVGLCDMLDSQEILDGLENGEMQNLIPFMDSCVRNDIMNEEQSCFSSYSEEENYIGDATGAYNCHSYAWYSQSLNNKIWLNSPEIYYSAEDASYQELENDQEPRVGDIIVYMKGNLANHSGIITGYTNNTVGDNKGNANMYMVTSKWGYGGLYLHKGEECPYYSSATSIKYYRLRTDGASEMSVNMSNFSHTKAITSRNDVAANGGSKAATYSMYELNVSEAGKYSITVSAAAPLSIYFLDVNRNTYAITPTVTEGDTYVYKFEGDFAAGNYYVRSEFADAGTSGNINTVVKHEHNYEFCVSYNDEYHVNKCACGETGNMLRHVIKSDGSLARYKPCMYCGHIIDTKSGLIFPIIKNKPIEIETE